MGVLPPVAEILDEPARDHRRRWQPWRAGSSARGCRRCRRAAAAISPRLEQLPHAGGAVALEVRRSRCMRRSCCQRSAISPRSAPRRDRQSPYRSAADWRPRAASRARAGLDDAADADDGKCGAQLGAQLRRSRCSDSGCSGAPLRPPRGPARAALSAARDRSWYWWRSRRRLAARAASPRAPRSAPRQVGRDLDQQRHPSCRSAAASSARSSSSAPRMRCRPSLACSSRKRAVLGEETLTAM